MVSPLAIGNRAKSKPLLTRSFVSPLIADRIIEGRRTGRSANFVISGQANFLYSGSMMAFHVSLVGRKDLSGEIHRQIRSAILDRRLRPGDPLPPGRELARTLVTQPSLASTASTI